MNSFKAFIKEKGLYLVCLALIFAATITSIWAIRNVVRNVAGATKSQEESKTEEDNTWDSPEAKVNNPVTDLPKPTSAPSAAPSASSQSSGAASQSAAAQSGSAGSAASSAQAGTSSAAPVAGEIAQPFSGDELVYSATLGDWRTHNGVDYACKAGDTVSACKSGEVTAAATDALWGGTVEVKDDKGVVWKYCGLAAPAVKVGDKVSTGDTLGKVGDLPSESKVGAHLHLECLEGETWLDPAAQLK